MALSDLTSISGVLGKIFQQQITSQINRSSVLLQALSPNGLQGAKFKFAVHDEAIWEMEASLEDELAAAELDVHVFTAYQALVHRSERRRDHP